MYEFGITVHTIEPGVHSTNFMNPENMESTLMSTWDNIPDDIQKQYGDQYIEEAIKVMLDQCVNGICARDITPVVNCYVHALLSKNPHIRYTPGYDARFLWKPLSLCPDWLADWITRQLLSIGGVPKPANIPRYT